MKNLFKYVLPLLVFCSLPKVSDAMGKIMYVPLDNRPVCLEYVRDTVDKAGYKLVIPPENILSNHRQKDNIPALWQWINQEAPSSAAAIIATDALNYGGLVNSRKHSFSQLFLRKRVDKIKNIKTTNPALKIYAFSTIMRTPRQSAGTVEPDYYKEFGPSIFRLSQLLDKKDLQGLSKEEKAEANKLESKIPLFMLQDWYKRRAVNYKINTLLIDAVKDDTFHILAIGKDDDAPLSQTHMESRHLKQYGTGIGPTKLQILPGVDQLGLLLITRAIQEGSGDRPKIHVVYAPGAGGDAVPLYSDESYAMSVEHQVAALGGRLTSKPDNADLVLAVNTPYNGQNLDSTANENASYIAKYNKDFAKTLKELTNEYPVSLADVSFANGADNGFMAELSKRNLLGKFVAYNGWNTADNTIGYALAQGLLAQEMKPQARINVLKVRYLDDWLYQANIRHRLSDEIDKRHTFYLKYDMGKYYNQVLSGTSSLFRKYLQETPFLASTTYTIEFPWNRLFEVDVRVTE